MSQCSDIIRKQRRESHWKFFHLYINYMEKLESQINTFKKKCHWFHLIQCCVFILEDSMQLAGTLEMCWRWIQYLCLHNKVYSHQVICTFSSFSTAGEFFLGSGSVSHWLGPLLDSMANALVLSRSLIRHVFIIENLHEQPATRISLP